MSDSTIRSYRDTDLEAVRRIWREVGWAEEGNEKENSAFETFLGIGNPVVAEINGDAECCVMHVPGMVRYLDTDLHLCVVAAVTTSHVARKRGLASRLTARALADATTSGAVVAMLGMFDQGFYDRLGFGTLDYENDLTFAPGSLRVDVPYRPPSRLSFDDWREIHTALLGRYRVHGGVTIDPPEVMQAELRWIEKPFGLGYRPDGRLTHFVYGDTKGENGPYTVRWLSYEQPSQLLELLRLLHELGDQVDLIRMTEPADVQLQDLISQPMRAGRTLRYPSDVSANRAAAWRQLRILDMASCVAAFTTELPELRFNATIADPVDGLLPEGSEWAGCGGEWTVTLGPSSSAKRGHTAGLPELSASVNAFSRLWFGVRPARGLALTTDCGRARSCSTTSTACSGCRGRPSGGISELPPNRTATTDSSHGTGRRRRQSLASRAVWSTVPPRWHPRKGSHAPRSGAAVGGESGSRTGTISPMR